MIRFILALLAVLSGIVSIGQPVSARVCAEQAQAMRRPDCVIVAEDVSSIAASRIPANTVPDMRGVGPAERPGSGLAFARTVRIRCDRALE